MVEGGTAHGWERSTDQLVCLEVPPAPYIKEQGGDRPLSSIPVWPNKAHILRGEFP